MRLYREEGLTGGKIAKRLGLPRQTVYNWIANFAEENANANPEMKKKTPRTSPGPTSQSPSEADEIKRLKAELAKKEKELAYQKLRADAYDEMINVAESKFNIAIRKKAGAKQ